jgi:ABC-2 type transport system permease protein
MSWRKVWVVASTEFGTAVRTKAFIVGLLLMPLLVAVSIGLQFLMKRVDTSPRNFAVIDRSGWLYPVIESAARERDEAAARAGWKQPPFQPSAVAAAGGDAQLLELSDRVRRGELFAFVEIPEDVAKPSGEAAVKYYSDTPNDNDLMRWLGGIINDQIRSRRFRDAGIDREVADRLSRPVATDNLGLLSRAAAASAGQPGAVQAAEKVDLVRTMAVPAGLMFTLFMVVMATAPQLLNTVLEEKMSKISEVLLGSITPFELMMGKLLGNLAIALLLAAIYVGGAFGVVIYYGYGTVLTPSIVAILTLFLTLAVLIYGSLYMAVGSACSELKDAQSLMMPVMILSIVPAWVWFPVVQNPAGPMSVGLSLFPFFNPYQMLMRMALSPAPPAWQVILSIVLTTATSVACVWAASKIFRVGLLMQGKPPSFRELAKWVVAK